MSVCIQTRPKSLSFDDAVIVFILLNSGNLPNTIAKKLGVSIDQLCEVLLSDIHPEAAEEAQRLVSG